MKIEKVNDYDTCFTCDNNVSIVLCKKAYDSHPHTLTVTYLDSENNKEMEVEQNLDDHSIDIMIKVLQEMKEEKL